MKLSLKKKEVMTFLQIHLIIIILITLFVLKQKIINKFFVAEKERKTLEKEFIQNTQKIIK